jgi:hypothetical protein
MHASPHQKHHLIIKITTVKGGYTFLGNSIDNKPVKGGYGVTKIKM